MNYREKVIVIAGPTASGKTALGIALARRLGGEIVSADSMQVYRRMDIGTAKASAEERSAVPHHMLDVAEPSESYSVARYVEDASRCCDGILSRGAVPLVVGGTGLYIDSLLSGRSFSECGDPSLRSELEARYDTIGGEAMLEELRSFDPERAAKLCPNDRRRIVRAMEIYRLTGMTITAHDEMTRAIPPRYEALRIVLGYRRREDLYNRINSRVDAMAASGLFDEVSSLLSDGISGNCTAMQAIGYKEAVSFLRGETSREEALEAIKLGSRRYAKRQLTWFGRWEDALRIEWPDSPDIPYALSFLEEKGVI